MAGRKLTRQQAFRIKGQEERLARAQKKAEKLEAGVEGEAQPGVVITRHGASAEVAAMQGEQLGEPIRCHLRANLGEVVCGDRVSFQTQGEEGLITAVQPRTRRLARPSPFGSDKVMAANIDQLMIVGALMPLPGPDTIDRFLIAAHLTDIEAVVVLNKIDLAGLSPELDELREELSELYRSLGHTVIETSIKRDEDLEVLRDQLAGRTSALVGQSGVGKSSLVQALLPEQHLRVGELDERGQGKHTTSQGRLYTLPSGGWLIDSPGIRAFGLSDLHKRSKSWSGSQTWPKPPKAVNSAIARTSRNRVAESTPHWTLASYPIYATPTIYHWPPKPWPPNTPARSRTLMEQLFIILQHILPKTLLSRLVGYAARCKIGPIKDFLIRSFIKAFKVDMSDYERQEPQEFENFNDFFHSQLKAGARPLPEDNQVLFSPVDGTISQIGETLGGRLIQAKGRDYRLADLLADDELAERLEGGAFATLYLAPKDYHRIHMPFDGTLKRMIHVPGELFSVNDATARGVQGVFARNERVVCVFDTEFGEVAMVLVGAMIVASIRTVWHGEVTPVTGVQQWDYTQTQNITLKRGAGMGSFALGSTVILCTEPEKLMWNDGADHGDSICWARP